ncbi:MAG: metallophosphoesterase, partial [Deltaproteobacteria bacterium]|nr:metallophosphoesterase [Deltaproteobacteria bacterium]
ASKDFQFVVYGDTRGNSIFQPSGRPEHEAEVKAILAHDASASFLVHTGDVALNMPLVSGPDRGYGEFFDVERALLAGRPIFTDFGNHESYDTAFFDGLMNAPSFAGAPHPHYFSMDWGRVHIAFLDSFEGKQNWLKGGERDPLLTDVQATWLDGDLAKAHAAGKLLFVVSHQGAFSYGKDLLTTHGGSPDVQKKVIPLMIKYGVLGIFAGHDHYYERGHEACIDYLVVGSGGANMHDPDTSHAGVIAGLGSPAYLVVTVKQGVATGEAKDATGKVFDSFTFQPAACASQGPDGAIPDVGAEDRGVPDGGVLDQSAGEGPSPDDGGADGASVQGDRGVRDVGVAAPGPGGGCDCRFDAEGEDASALGGWLFFGLLGLLVRATRRRRSDD